jgi:hypothetical protein
MRKHHREFNTSVGVSGPHDFAVRKSIVRPHGQAALRHSHVHRIPHPTSVTIAIRPSSMRRDGVRETRFLEKRNRNIFALKADRSDPVEPADEMNFSAPAISAAMGWRSEGKAGGPLNLPRVIRPTTRGMSREMLWARRAAVYCGMLGASKPGSHRTKLFGVVPANAGTHIHGMSFGEGWNSEPASITSNCGYGSSRARGRHRMCGAVQGRHRQRVRYPASFSISLMIASPISLVEAAVVPSDLMSAVRRPLARTAAMAASSLSASAPMSKE